MPRATPEREAGQRWLVDALGRDERVHALRLSCEWGPQWQHLPKKAPPKREATLLILARERVRKVAWLNDDDLESAGREDGHQAVAQQRLLIRIGGMVDDLASRLAAKSA